MIKIVKGITGGLIAFLLIVSGAGALNNTNYLSNALGGNLLSTSESSPNIYFRNEKLLKEHYESHGKEMGFSSAEEYQKAAAMVIKNDASLHKKEKEDGDDVYYLESTNEIVFVSKDGYIRTYFHPDDGLDYYDRQ